MGICMALWAIVSALTAVCHNFVGLLLVRFFLGVTEAPYYPGAVYLLTIFYTRKEIATRIAILYTGNILATAFAGLIAAGVFHGMDGKCIVSIIIKSLKLIICRNRLRWARRMAVAFHPPGRRHLCHRNHRLLLSPGHTSHHQVAHS